MSANMDRTVYADRSPTQRSRVSNDNQLLIGIDGRSAWARRYRDLLSSHVADLGGPDAVSEAERSIIRRACALTVELERLESQFAQSDADGPSMKRLVLHQRMANTLRRLLVTTGLHRRARDVGPAQPGALEPFLHE